MSAPYRDSPSCSHTVIDLWYDRPMGKTYEVCASCGTQPSLLAVKIGPVVKENLRWLMFGEFQKQLAEKWRPLLQAGNEWLKRHRERDME